MGLGVNMFKFVGYRYEPFICKVYTMDESGENLKNLPKYFDDVNHSPTGFEWGYGGSGPAQLAYAILRKFFTTKHTPSEAKRLALLYYQDFKWEVVAKFEKSGFVLKNEDIEFWFRKHLTIEAYDSIIGSH
jgi:hypothetical protein